MQGSRKPQQSLSTKISLKCKRLQLWHLIVPVECPAFHPRVAKHSLSLPRETNHRPRGNKRAQNVARLHLARQCTTMIQCCQVPLYSNVRVAFQKQQQGNRTQTMPNVRATPPSQLQKQKPLPSSFGPKKIPPMHSNRFKNEGYLHLFDIFPGCRNCWTHHMVTTWI